MSNTEFGLQLQQLSVADRQLLTPEVVRRWTADVVPGDVTAQDIVALEKRRRQILETVRQGAELTDLEFKFVRYLQRHQGQTRTYLQIAQHMWGSAARPIRISDLRAQNGYASPWIQHIWVLAGQIRKKLEIDPTRPQHLSLQRGVGYAWYDLPPSHNDGIDYSARSLETEGLRLELQAALGGEGVEGRLALGPAHPDYDGEPS